MESTLSLKRSDFTGAVGLFLGYGRGADNGDSAWSTYTTAVIDQIVSSGLRQFYYPPPVNGVSYDWSWLHPVASLLLPSGADAVALPDDFGGFEGQIALATDNAQQWWPIDLCNEGMVEAKQAAFPNNTGQPQLAALSPIKTTTMTAGQRTNMRFWPTADQDYTLRFQYYFLPDALSGTRPYALGGSQHAETILESCLSIAEERLDDAQGIHKAKWMERLAASISLDRRSQPIKLGRNEDYSDAKRMRRRNGWWHDQGINPVTFNGVVSS